MKGAHPIAIPPPPPSAGDLDTPPAAATPASAAPSCYHGGLFFKSIGEDFDDLDRRHLIINADVLDAWFPPAPGVRQMLHQHGDWLLRTSPPTHCEGFLRAVAASRGVAPECLLPGAGSSDLIYRVLGRWLNSQSRVLIFDPTYGEYSHFLTNVISCHVDRFPLRREHRFVPDFRSLRTWLQRDYDLVIIVNPNSPTGHHMVASELQCLLEQAPAKTKFWIDETYVDFVDSNQSLELYASQSTRTYVCKSMSKAYALSGARAAYLCGPPEEQKALRKYTPPWVIGLPTQVAAVHALQDLPYYRARWKETRALRQALEHSLRGLAGLSVVSSGANFLLLECAPPGPAAAPLWHQCATHGLFLRNMAGLGSQLSDQALRLAVKDAATNQRMVQILQHSMNQCLASA